MKLTSTELHIWHIALGNHANTHYDPHAAESSLPSEEERTQAARFTNPRLHQDYVFTRWAMRSILASYLTIAPRNVALTLAPLGKPQLVTGAHALDLRFNLTHSGELALFSVSLSHEVGVDLEKVGQKPRPMALAKRYFTAETVVQLSALPAQQQQRALLSLWTQYEAYKKAQGVGLRGGDDLLPLNPRIHQDTFQDLVPPTTPGDSAEWLVAQLGPAENYVGAVVIKNTCATPAIEHIDYSAAQFN